MMKFGQWINGADSGETADQSIASQDAVAQTSNDDNIIIRNSRKVDYNGTNSHREQRILHEKSNNKSQGQILAEWRLLIQEKLGVLFAIDNIKNNLRLILGVMALILILIFVAVFTIDSTKKKNYTIPGDFEEDLFDFSDIEGTDNPTTLVFVKPTGTPSISFFDFQKISRVPSSKPSTQQRTISYSESPSISLSLFPSTPPPTGSNAPSEVPSTTPTYIPSQLVEPIARPPIIPFSDEDSDSILTFCVIADAPYTSEELGELPNQIATQMEGCEFLVHLGDIFVGDTPCDIEDYETMQNIMLRSHAPAFLVPGDNEWNDCIRSNIDIGWNHWTNHFVRFEDNWNHTFSVIRQPGYVENFYFMEKRTLVFGLNIVGGRVHNETEWGTRLRSEYSWVRQIMLLNLVDMNRADGVILMAHAHPDEDHSEFFNPFRVFLRDELKNEFPVLYLHGDGHNFIHTPNYQNQSNYLRIQHEGGTNEPVLKIMAGPGRGSEGRSSVHDAFQYDRQLENFKSKKKNG